MAAAARALGAAMVLALAIPAAAAKPKAPDVVVSILPIHSLVAGVMAGVGTPKLLINRLASPHDYAMRPSDAEALNKADLVVWVGPTLESFLIKPLSTLSKKTKIITLTREPSLHVIHIAGGKGATRAGTQAGLDVDPHVWMDPDNAIAITRVVAAALKKIDPGNASTYDSNAEAQIDDLIDLDMSTSEMTAANFADKPVILYHDSLRYFAKRYGLEIAGSILVGDRLPGARHMSDLRNIIAERNIRCVFTEPEFSPAMAQALIEGTHAKIAQIDPLGTKLQPGPGAYRFLIEGVFGSILSCLRD
ncbi:MAG TPA: zinc ABC transporter substrate-binding protein [Alphaproteobacteria bacterium]|nr:zinc ABC transporter substrate-binding protein [Alphaproteobacteria bacterium]